MLTESHPKVLSVAHAQRAPQAHEKIGNNVRIAYSLVITLTPPLPVLC